MLFFARSLLAPVAFGLLVFGGPVARQPSTRATQTLIPLVSSDSLSYFVNATVGNQQFSLQIDTAEPDSWLLGAPTGVDQGVEQTLEVEGITGETFASTFILGGVSVENQVYVQTQDPGYSTLPGVLGFGFTDSSDIVSGLDEANVNASSALSFLDNLSTQAAAPFVSLYLPRSNKSAGSLGLGAVLPNMSQITKQPQLPVPDDIWRVELAADAVLVNGQNISLPENIFQDGGNLTASFDSGLPMTLVDSSIASAIYGLLATATFDEESNAWSVPCDSEVNVTIRFLGFDVFVHPLDAVTEAGLGNSTCLGSFQPFGDDDNPDSDIILGTSFMHNVYLLLAPSGFAADGSDGPYVQVLPLTNATQAHHEFVAARSPPPQAAAPNDSGTFNFGATPQSQSSLSSGVLPTSTPSRMLAISTLLAILCSSL